jgi:hypothetical protein
MDTANGTADVVGTFEWKPGRFTTSYECFSVAYHHSVHQEYEAVLREIAQTDIVEYVHLLRCPKFSNDLNSGVEPNGYVFAG